MLKLVHKRSVVKKVLGLRCYKVLAVESSCDDSCVALLEKRKGQTPIIIDQAKKTLNSIMDGGIIPTNAHEFHQHSLAQMVKEFCAKHEINAASPPDLVCCTRGPGLVGSLSAGLQLSKGLSLAWNRPLLGVHHMLGHIMVANLTKSEQPLLGAPKYPFLSLLCSGGHTMLVLSKSISEHDIIIDTTDIAAGDSLDKCSREMGFYGNMIGKELEKYVYKICNGNIDHFIQTHIDYSDFDISLPMRGTKHAKIPETISFSFASFLSTVQGYKKKKQNKLTEEDRQIMSTKVQEAIFNHIIDRVNVALMKHGNCEQYNGDGKFDDVRDIVCSGGVASNRRLRQKLKENLLHSKCLKNEVDFHFPDLSNCTDNAVMIGAAGMEIFEELNLVSSLDILPLRKWPLNELLHVDGWERHSMMPIVT